MTIILKENNPELRTKLRNSGINLCKCCEFNGAIWLDYSPDVTDHVHGVGYYDDEVNTKSVEEELARYVAEVKDPVYCKDVDEFIKLIKEYPYEGLKW